MTDQLISFETAKLAKEKGFKNSYVEMCWIQSKNINWDKRNLPRKDVPYLADGCDTIIQPTQSLLQKWLREKHKIFIEVSLNFKDKFNVAIYDRRHKEVLDTIKNKIFLDSSNNFKSYEEALEQGLIEALKLIP